LDSFVCPPGSSPVELCEGCNVDFCLDYGVGPVALAAAFAGTGYGADDGGVACCHEAAAVRAGLCGYGGGDLAEFIPAAAVEAEQRCAVG